MSRAAEMEMRARALRGPWWWRLRCWAADCACAVACALEPDDRSSLSWYSDDGESISFARIRRPAERNGAAAS